MVRGQAEDGLQMLRGSEIQLEVKTAECCLNGPSLAVGLAQGANLSL